MGEIMADATALEPLAEFLAEEIIRKILTPERGIFHACLGERSIQIQHPNEPRPLTAPVGDGEDRSAMRGQAGEHVVGVLPDCLGNNEGGLGIKVAENFHPLTLAGNESVPGSLVQRMSTHDFKALRPDRLPQDRLHRLLGRPADLVCGQSKIATGDELDLIFHQGHKFERRSFYCKSRAIRRRANQRFMSSSEITPTSRTMAMMANSMFWWLVVRVIMLRRT